MKQTKNNYTLPIVMMFALFFMISFVTGLQNPMGVAIKSQFGASTLVSQLGNFANFIAYAFMGIPAGIILSRIGYKKTALIAVAVGFIGVSITLVSGLIGDAHPQDRSLIFTVYIIGAFVSGFSMCMLNTVVNPMLNTLGGGGNRGNQLIQMGGSLNSIGATIVPVIVGYLMGDFANASVDDAIPVLWIAMGIFAVVFVVLASMYIPEPHIQQKEKKGVKDKYSPWNFRHFVLGTIAIFVYVGIEVGIPNIANLFMTHQLNISTTVAGSIVGTYWFLMLIGRLIGSAVGARVSSTSMLRSASIIALALILTAIFLPIRLTIDMPVFQSDMSFGMVDVPVNILLITLCGLCTSVMWGGIFNLAVEGLGKYTSTASGIFMMMVCGGGILPALQGQIADISSYLTSYWVVAAGFAYILFYALVGYKNVNKNIPVD